MTKRQCDYIVKKVNGFIITINDIIITNGIYFVNYPNLLFAGLEYMNSFTSRFSRRS